MSAETPAAAAVPFQPALADFIAFRDAEACARVRAIPRSALTAHPNPDFRINVIDQRAMWQRFFGLVEPELRAPDEQIHFPTSDRIGNLDAYMRAGARLVTLDPMTLMQNALHSFGGDWSQVPPKATTIGPREILGARHRSFWLDGDLGGGISWQRFIARLVAHGPVSELVPGSILQTARTDYTLLGGVADDIAVDIT